jgi:hypothetical protein
MPVIDSLAKGVMAKVCSGWRNRVKFTRFLGWPEKLLATTQLDAGFRPLVSRRQKMVSQHTF